MESTSFKIKGIREDTINILHLSWEVPDCILLQKTPAVSRLIAETSKYFTSTTLSFNRNNKSIKTFIVDEGNQKVVEYFGLPFGIFHISSMRRLFCDVKEYFDEKELVHGHKLTYEGVLCYYAKQKFGIPYVLTLRSNTDFKLINYLPHHRMLFRRVTEGAEKIFCLTPWSAKKLGELFPNVKNRTVVLPNICYVEKFMDKSYEPRSFLETNRKLTIVTTFNLNLYKMKGFETTLRIIKRLSMPVRLLVIGSGEPRAEDSIRKLIRRYGAVNNVHLLGFKTRQEIIEIYKRCDIFLLPSKSESFGLAYLEALSCGLPVFQRRNAGLDGYFDESPFYITVQSEEEFVCAIEEIYPKIDSIRAQIKEFLGSTKFEKFFFKKIVNKYVSSISEIL